MNSLENLLQDAPELKSLTISRQYFRNINKEISFFFNLEKLDCSNNNITKLTKAIYKCEKLTELNISNNKLKFLPDSFSLCTNLITLKFNNNTLQEINCNELINLSHLDCSNNKLKKCILDKCNKLTFLNLQYNLIQDILLPNFLYDNEIYLEYNVLTSIPNLNQEILNLSLSANNFFKFSKELFDFKQCRLINLSQNKLSDKELFDYVPSWIIECNLSSNRFFEDFILKEKIQSKIEFLDISNNNIDNFELFIENLRHLNVSNNKITILDISGCKKLNTLIANNNFVDQETIKLPLQNNLKKIDLSYNNFTCIPIFESLYIEYINFEHNEIQKIPKNINFPNLSIFNVSINKINKISKEFCINHKNLKILNLSGNDLINLPHELFAIEKLEKIFAFNNKNMILNNIKDDIRLFYSK
jgi:Leucine-rich repeat (LRR) protein